MTDLTDYAEMRKHWRPRWLASIQEFADYPTQRAKWLDPENTNPHWSFIEIMCCYFDDCGLTEHDGGYAEAFRVGLVSQAEAEAVADFHALADAYNAPRNDDYDDAAVLADPDWLTVVDAAQVAQGRLASLVAADERNLLLEP